eukprot:EG_transcript_18493
MAVVGGWQKQMAAVWRLGFRLFGLMCVAIAWTLILGTIYVYFQLIFPRLVELRSLRGVLLFTPSSWLSFNTIFNYAMVLWTHPGKPAGSLTKEEEAQMLQEKAPLKGKGWTKFCKHCKLPKPPRAHHCHMCGTCILKMDHHCPWINACVGHFNHRYFILFVLYLGLSCLWAVLTLALYYLGLLASPAKQEPNAPISALIFTFAICLPVFLSMLLFFGWNFYLVTTNQTTIEFHYNRDLKEQMKSRGEVYTNPYDVGITRNLLQVFGPFRSYWAVLLPSVAKLPFDGTRWLSVRDPTDIL